MKVAQEQLKETLRSCNLKATPARINILRVLFESQAPLSVQSIISKMKFFVIDQATVYRTLNMFETVALVCEVDLQHGHAHYELTDRPHHHHLVCRHCGKIEDVEGCRVQNIEKAAIAKRGFAAIEDHALEFFGICKACDRVA